VARGHQAGDTAGRRDFFFSFVLLETLLSWEGHLL
jgi:hypothetical protein